jgi:adenylate cyclase
MLRRLERFALARLGPRYPRGILAVLYGLSFLVVSAGVLLLRLYTPLSDAALARILGVAAALVAVEVAAALCASFRLLRPADPWLHGDRSPEAAVRAWRALAGLPLDLIRLGRGLPVLVNVVPISVFVTLELDEPSLAAFLAILAGAFVVLAYGVFLRFFTTELALRPVLEQVSCGLPDGVELGRATAPLGWRLLVALPAINVITGVVVVGLAAPEPSLRTLGSASSSRWRSPSRSRSGCPCCCCAPSSSRSRTCAVEPSG